MNAPPKFSIITVVRNNPAGLIATIRSALQQDRRLFEHIVIDGASTDLTSEVLKQFKPYLTHVVSEPDAGIYDAMNKGIDLARGQWLYFLNCEDAFFDKETLRDVSVRLNDDDEIVYGQCLNSDTGKIHAFKPLHLYWAGMTFDHQAAFVRAGIYKALRYDVRYRINADFDFFSRARVAGLRFREVQQVIARKPYQGGASDDVMGRLRERYSIARRHFPDKPIADQFMLEIFNAR